MSELLLVRLGSRYQEPVSWVVWCNSAQKIASSGQLVAASELYSIAHLCDQRNVIALVPGCDVILKAVSFAGRLSRRDRGALPFLLEEHIASDPNSLHVVLQAKEKDFLHLLAADREQMRAWLNWLTEGGLTPIHVFPDVMMLPYVDDRWTALQIGSQWLFRQSMWQGAVVDEALLQDWFDFHTDSPRIISYTEAAPGVGQHWEVETSGAPFKILAQNIPDKRHDLLQGEFSENAGWREKAKAWKLPALLSVMLIVLLSANQGITILRLALQKESLQQQMIALYRETFPQTKRVINPYVQFRQSIESLSATAEPEEFSSLLEAVAERLSVAKNVSIQNLKYDGTVNELQFRITGASFDNVREVAAEMPVAYKAVVENLAEEDGKVTASITLRF